MSKPQLYLLVLLCFISACNLGLAIPLKTWCVAKPSTEQSSLVDNINFACSKVDCSIIHNGQQCSIPDTLINHASVAMNLYYQANGRHTSNCFFGHSGVIVHNDPSYGSCIYA